MRGRLEGFVVPADVAPHVFLALVVVDRRWPLVVHRRPAASVHVATSGARPVASLHRRRRCRVLGRLLLEHRGYRGLQLRAVLTVHQL